MAGSTRSSAPLRRTGSPVGSADALERSAPPRARRRSSRCHRRRRAGRRTGSSARRPDAGRAAVLAVVGIVEARAVSTGHVEGAVRAEAQVADGMARELLAPVVDQDLLRGRDAAAHRQADEAAADQAAVGVGTRHGGAGVIPARRAPARDGVARVEGVHVRAGREGGIERHPEEAAVPVVVDVGLEVREDRRRGVRDAVEDLDDAGLLGDEDAAVRREPQGCRQGQARPHVGVVEAGQRVRRRANLEPFAGDAGRTGRPVIGQEAMGRRGIGGGDRQRPRRRAAGRSAGRLRRRAMPRGGGTVERPGRTNPLGAWASDLVDLAAADRRARRTIRRAPAMVSRRTAPDQP